MLSVGIFGMMMGVLFVGFVCVVIIDLDGMMVDMVGDFYVVINVMLEVFGGMFDMFVEEVVSYVGKGLENFV